MKKKNKTAPGVIYLENTSPGQHKETLSHFLGTDAEDYVPGLPTMDLHITALQNGQFVISESYYTEKKLKMNRNRFEAASCYDRYNAKNFSDLREHLEKILARVNDQNFED